MHEDEPFGKFSDSIEVDANRMPAIHPVYVIPYSAVSEMQKWSKDNPAKFD